jgi:hypothetical protein
MKRLIQMDVRLLGATAVVLATDRLVHQRQQARRAICFLDINRARTL